MKIHAPSASCFIIAGPVASLASSSTDQEIKNAAKSSCNYRTVLGNHVRVKVDYGIVTLTGAVENKDESNLAVSTVANLPGVTGVKNELTIKSTSSGNSDSRMAFKIRSRLLVKGNVCASATKVSAKDGLVTLSRTADSQAQKNLTKADAREIALANNKGTSALGAKVITNGGVNSPHRRGQFRREKILGHQLAQDFAARNRSTSPWRFGAEWKPKPRRRYSLGHFACRICAISMSPS